MNNLRVRQRETKIIDVPHRLPIRSLVGLGGVIAVLTAAGHGALAGPPSPNAEAWRHWLEGREGVDAAVALLRLATLVAAAYLLAVTVALATPRFVAAVRASATRQVVRTTLGVGAVSASVVPLAAAADGTSDAPVAVMRRLTEPPVPVHEEPPPDARPHAPPVDAWAVRPGDHFWSIAERVLEAARGRPPSIAEVDRYWRALVAANHDRLAVPGEPDLLYPGQELRLPPA